MTFTDLAAALDEIPARWGVRVERLAPQREVLFTHGPDAVLPAASIGKLALLRTLARRIDAGDIALDEPLRRDAVPPVADSGLWQHLTLDTLTVADAATLVGTVSDNLATNVLLHRLGGVDALAAIDGLTLWDAVRDVRTPVDPPTLSTASASGCVALFAELAADPGTRVLGWLAGGMDLSMVAAAFGLDPLAHAEPDRGLVLHHKTGTDAGVRADSGLVHGPGGTVAYACLAQWSPAGDDDPVRDLVLALMRRVGDGIRSAIG